MVKIDANYQNGTDALETSKQEAEKQKAHTYETFTNRWIIL